MALGLFSALLLVMIVTIGIAFANASLLRIRRAEIYLPNLPQGFNGLTILFASDIDLCGINTSTRAGEMFKQLQSLQPDMLILGGDYNSTALLDRLNRPEINSSDFQQMLDSRADFFHYISVFQAPLGKYAIASDEDIDWQNLIDVMSENGIRPLFNERIAIHADSDTLWLAGICGKVSSLNAAGHSFRQNDFVLVVAERPDLLPILLTSEASDGGPWADMVLCGHTHGGQIHLFGRTALSLSDADKRFLRGWNTQTGIPILTTEGVGCEGINLRLGTEPEIWLITQRGL